MNAVSEAPDQAGENHELILRLYVAGNAPNSTQALSNIHEICQKHLKNWRYKLEVIDVLDEPERALGDGVVITPTLVRIKPLPQLKIIGNLKQRDKVIQLLGIKEVSS